MLPPDTPSASETTAPLSLERIRRAPKVLLHDHLDGGLRPATVLDLAREAGYPDLPYDNATDLGDWFRRAADSGSLELYLRTFAHVVAVTQTREALARIAEECAEDLAEDGIVYAEVRFAPEQHTERGLTVTEVVEAVLDGFRTGIANARAEGRSIRIGVLLCAMRQHARATEIAELVVRYREQGVVGFDIAGPEAGFPPSRNLDAFEYLRKQNAHFTIHAGEAFGLPSIWEAIQYCGAERLGHGVRIIDDITLGGDSLDGRTEERVNPALGLLAGYVRDRRIPLEMCPSSNVQTGAVPSIAEHPIGLLTRLRFRVTVNTDNRLMSGCTLSSEFAALSSAFGYTWDDLQWFTLNAMKSAFISFDERLALINDVIKPAYARKP